MKLSELIRELNQFLSKHGDMDCITSQDDEGNGYNDVYGVPELRFVKNEGFSHYDSAYDIDDIEYKREEAEEYDDEWDDNEYTQVCLI